jgi:hypothetical protein
MGRIFQDKIERERLSRSPRALRDSTNTDFHSKGEVETDKGAPKRVPMRDFSSENEKYVDGGGKYSRPRD